MLISRFRTSLILQNSFIGSTLAATHVASFHSTPPSSDKWKTKWKFSGVNEKEPSKVSVILRTWLNALLLPVFPLMGWLLDWPQCSFKISVRALSFIRKRKPCHFPSTLVFHHEAIDDLKSGWESHIFSNIKILGDLYFIFLNLKPHILEFKGALDLTGFCRNHVRFVTRERRADAKKALKDLLYNSGSSFQNKESKWSLGGRWSSEESFDQPGNCDKKGRAKSSMRNPGKSQNKRTNRKYKRESFVNDFDNDSETIFHAAFGNRSYTWSFASSKDSSQNSASGFKWTVPPNWKNRRATEWVNSSDCESDEETADVGSCSDRTILGLPKTGPINIEEVKTAFRLSALKWHPDKHQGSSQAMAEEKFKLCVNAYKSLCCALSPG